MRKAMKASSLSEASALFTLAAIVLCGTLFNIRFVQRFSDTLGCYNLQIDSEIYHNVAKTIAESGVIHIPITHPPGFMLFLALIYRLFGVAYVFPKVVFACLIAVTAVLVFRMGSRMLGAWTGVVAAALVTLSPLLRSYSATLQYEIFAMTFLTLAITAAFDSLERPRGYRKTFGLIATGFLLGAAVLSREPFALLIFCFPIWILLGPDERKQKFINSACVVLLPISMAGGWILYQYLVTGVLVPISDKGPVNFYIGNNPNASGTFNLVASTIGEPKGWEFIRQEPAKFLQLSLKRLFYFFGFVRDGWAVPESGAALLSRATAFALPLEWALRIVRGLLPAMALATIASCATGIFEPSTKTNLIRLATVVAIVLIPHLFLISSVRFLIPVYPLCALIAAAGVVQTLRLRIAWFTIVILGIVGLIGTLWQQPNGGRWNLTPLNFEGRARIVELKTGGEGIEITPIARPEVAAFINEEFLSSGFLKLSFAARSEKPVTAVVVFLLDDSNSACRYEFTAGPDPSSQEVPCYIPKGAVVKPLFYLDGPDPLVLSDVRITYGSRTFPMSNERTVFASGWADPEPKGGNQSFRWSLGRASTIVFGATGKIPVSVRFSANSFGGPATVSVRVNERELTSFSASPNSWTEQNFVIPPDLLVSGANVVAFDFSQPKRPCDLGNSNDCRELTIGVTELTVEERNMSETH